jgi:hypothetical protein
MTGPKFEQRVGPVPPSISLTGAADVVSVSIGGREFVRSDALQLLCRALLTVEWADLACASPNHCAGCWKGEWVHASDCPVDAALTAAGFETKEKRDAARKIMIGGIEP